MGYPLDSGSPKALWFGRSIDASTLHPECIQGCQTPVWTRSDHEAAFGADQGSRTRHGHRRLGNVVLSASLSGSRQWPTTVCCGHLSQMDTPLRSKWGIHLTQVAPRRCGGRSMDAGTQNAPWGARRRSAGNWATRLRFGPIKDYARAMAIAGLETWCYRHPFRGPPMANHSMLWSPESNGYPT